MHPDPSRLVVLSGCSGGGKSTLLAELARRGRAIVEEPGRRIVAEEVSGDGSALPWVDSVAFARRAVAMALEDRAQAAGADRWVFFDRGLVDAAAGWSTPPADRCWPSFAGRTYIIGASSSRRHGPRSTPPTPSAGTDLPPPWTSIFASSTPTARSATR
jgi:nicotinamide riboside kinase